MRQKSDFDVIEPNQLYTYTHYPYDMAAGELSKVERHVKVFLRDKKGVRRKHYDAQKNFLYEDYILMILR